MKVRDILIWKIFTTKNVRLEPDGELGDLMESIAQHELLQPIGVVPRGERYEVVWGHRRLAAAKMRNEQTIACRILEHISESDIPLIKLQENIQRKQLSAEEIVAAADEMKRRRPELTDGMIDMRLGKQRGYLSFYRNLLLNVAYLREKGFSKKAVEAMNADEIRAMRAKIEGDEKDPGKRKSTFHRGARTPSEGFSIVNSRGPNVVCICSSIDVKERVLKSVKSLQKRIR